MFKILTKGPSMSATTDVPRKVRRSPGSPADPCSVEGCERPSIARGWCEPHYQRWRRHGSTDEGRGGPPVIDNPTYRTQHIRVRRARGRAADQTCPCGQPAAQWAYDHTDPAPLTEFHNGCTVLYSNDVARFVALCIPCHRAFDKER